MATLNAEPKFDPSTLLNDGPESNFARSPELNHRFGTLRKQTWTDGKVR